MGQGFYYESDQDVLLPVSYWSIGGFPNSFTIISGKFVEQSVPNHILNMLTVLKDLPSIPCFLEITSSQLIRFPSATPAVNAPALRRGPPRRVKQQSTMNLEIPDNQITGIKMILNKPDDDKDYRPGDRIWFNLIS